MFSFFFYLLPLWLTDPDSSQRRKKRERDTRIVWEGTTSFLFHCSFSSTSLSWSFFLSWCVWHSKVESLGERETGVWIALRAEGNLQNFLKERERETGINIADHGEELEGCRKGLFEEAKKNRDADKTQGTVRGEADLVWIHLTLSSQTVLKKWTSLKESQSGVEVSLKSFLKDFFLLLCHGFLSPLISLSVFAFLVLPVSFCSVLYLWRQNPRLDWRKHSRRKKRRTQTVVGHVSVFFLF